MSVKTRRNMDMIEVPIMAETLERFFDTFVVADENSKVSSDHLYSLYQQMCEEWNCDVYPKLTFHYFLRKRYPKQRQKQLKYNRHLRSQYTYGIKISIVIEFDLTRPWSWIPKGYYVHEKTTKAVTISRNHSHPESAEKPVPVFDIVLMKNGKWDLCYCNICVNMLKINDLKKYSMTKAGVQEITDMVENLPVCVELLAADDEIKPKRLPDYWSYAKISYLGNRMVMVNFIKDNTENKSKDICRIDICHSRTNGLLILLHVTDSVQVKILPFNKRKGTGWKIVNFSQSESLFIPVFESDFELGIETGALQEEQGEIISYNLRRMIRRGTSLNKSNGLETDKVGKRRLDGYGNSHDEHIKKTKFSSTSNQSNKMRSASGLWTPNNLVNQPKFITEDLHVKYLSQGYVFLPENENGEITVMKKDDNIDKENLGLPKMAENMTKDSEQNGPYDNITIKEEPASEDEKNRNCSETVFISPSINDIKQEMEEESLPLLLTCTSENFTSSQDPIREEFTSSPDPIGGDFTSSPDPIRGDITSSSDPIGEDFISSPDPVKGYFTHSPDPTSLPEFHPTTSEHSNFMSENHMSTSDTPHFTLQHQQPKSKSGICRPFVHRSISDIIIASHNPVPLNQHKPVSAGYNATLPVNRNLYSSPTNLCDVASQRNASVKEGLKTLITSRVRGRAPTVTISSISAGQFSTPSMSAGQLSTSSMLAGQLPTPSMSAGQLPTPSVSAGQFPTPSMSAGQFSSSSMSAGQPPLLMSAGGFPTPLVSTGQFPTLSMSPCQFTSSSMSAGQLSSSVMSVGQFPTSSTSAGQFQIPSVSAGQFPAVSCLAATKNPASNMPTLRSMLSSEKSFVSILPVIKQPLKKDKAVQVYKPNSQKEKPVQVFKYTLLSVKKPLALIKHSENSEKIKPISAKAVSRSDDVVLMNSASTESQSPFNDVGFKHETQNSNCIVPVILNVQNEQKRKVYQLDSVKSSSDTNKVDAASTTFKNNFQSQTCNITREETNPYLHNHENNMLHVEDTLTSGIKNESQTYGNLPIFVEELIGQPQVDLSQLKQVNIATLPVTSVGDSVVSSSTKVNIDTIPTVSSCTPSKSGCENNQPVVKTEDRDTKSEFSNATESKTNPGESFSTNGFLDNLNQSICCIDSVYSYTQEKFKNILTPSTVQDNVLIQSLKEKEKDQTTVDSQLNNVSSSGYLQYNSPFDSSDSSDYDYTSSEDEQTDENSLISKSNKDTSVVMVAVEHDVYETDKGKAKPVENLEAYQLKTSEIKVENGEIKLSILNPEMSTRPNTQVVKVLNSTNKILNVQVDGSLRSIAPLSIQSYLNYSTSQTSNSNFHSVLRNKNDKLSMYEALSKQSNISKPLVENSDDSRQQNSLLSNNYLDPNSLILQHNLTSEVKQNNLTSCSISSDSITPQGKMLETENSNMLKSSSSENVGLHNVSTSDLNPQGVSSNKVAAPCESIANISGFYSSVFDVSEQDSATEYAEEIVKMSRSKDIKHFQNLNMKLQRQIPYDFLKVRIPREIYMDPCLNRPSFVVLERLQRNGNLSTCKSKSTNCNRLCRSQTIRKYKDIPIDIHLS